MSEEKKKARELIDKFYQYASFDERYQDSESEAKQCALICVDEIIEVLPLHSMPDTTAFWNLVRKELTNQ